MKAAVIAGKQKLEIVDVPIPEIRPDELLIRILVCGMCMSEYPLWDEGTDIGRRMGHESVGIVEQVGRDTVGFKVGDRVTGIYGKSFAEYTSTHYTNVVHVPDELEDYEGISEPLACLVSGAERTAINLGDDVAIIGTGYMGLGFLQLMNLKGAGKIIAVDVREDGLKNALKLGASEAYFPEAVPVKYIIDEWKGDLFAQGVHAVIETSGTQPGLELAGKMTKPHGFLSIVGYHQSNHGNRTVEMQLWNWKAITVVNAHERHHQLLIQYCKSALTLIKEGKLDVKPLYTHAYKLDDINLAFYEMKSKPDGYIKGYIKF